MRDRSGETDKHYVQLVRSFDVQGALHPCCVKAENLREPQAYPDGSGATYRECRICHAKHHTAKLLPGRLGLRS